MSKEVNIHDAKTRLAEPKPGRLRGRVRIRRNFDEPLPPELFEEGQS
ncbi:MAG TPA: hypothetical protein VGA33_05845 [Thermoanaerobaculia bacterium]